MFALAKHCLWGRIEGRENAAEGPRGEEGAGERRKGVEAVWRFGVGLAFTGFTYYARQFKSPHHFIRAHKTHLMHTFTQYHAITRFSFDLVGHSEWTMGTDGEAMVFHILTDSFPDR